MAPACEWRHLTNIYDILYDPLQFKHEKVVQGNYNHISTSLLKCPWLKPDQIINWSTLSVHKFINTWSDTWWLDQLTNIVLNRISHSCNDQLDKILMQRITAWKTASIYKQFIHNTPSKQNNPFLYMIIGWDRLFRRI